MNTTIEKWLEFSKKQRMIENNLESGLSKNDLSLNEFYVLYALNLKDDKKLRLQDLQKHVGLSQSAMSRLVTRLESKDFGAIERSICKNDKRGIYIHLTIKGETILADTSKVVTNILKEDF
ncbi:MarR family winged helix-turn-helix transcriptional regulator [Companilactobacillus kedongensis]|uniref:MarR family winged helix-turn-helix transcriptional regulator n=1 Tax=Companilactobacillus kedongensis TaxID=2486004 RepID=UPI000F76C5B6|nr:MarR family transcriptional regulator [Companilactobacillus kedongensis]